MTACAELAEYAGHWRAVQYTGFTLNGLRAGGMTVGPAGDKLVGELNEAGKTDDQRMAAEAAGAEGQAIIDAYHGV